MLHSRMVNILLPAYSRQYSALRGAGLVTAADEMENHELEHLVLRERGVVWADQEGTEQQLKGERTGVESQEINQARNIGPRSELAPVLSFSHLQYHQSSPCSKSSYSDYPQSYHLFFCCSLFSTYLDVFGLTAKLLNDGKVWLQILVMLSVLYY